MASPGKKPGSPKTGGRKKGTLNKKTEKAIQIMADNKFCPITGMIEVYRKAIEGVEKICGEITVVIPDYALAGQMAKELAQYKHPKLKSIEHSGVDGEEIKTQSKVVIEGL